MKKYFIYIGIALFLSAQTIAAPVYLTQTTSQVPVEFGGVNCVWTDTWANAGNQYFRLYDLEEYGILNDLQVTQVEFGVGWAQGANSSGQQLITINIYTLIGPLLYSNLTPISSTQIILPDQYLTTVVYNVNATIIPAGSIMAIELVVIEEGEFSGKVFMIGANSLGQTNPCYLASDGCGIPEPVETGLIGFPDEHSIINVYGESQGIADVPVSNWAIFLGVGLMVVITVFIARRRIA